MGVTRLLGSIHKRLSCLCLNWSIGYKVKYNLKERTGVVDLGRLPL